MKHKLWPRPVLWYKIFYDEGKNVCKKNLWLKKVHLLEEIMWLKKLGGKKYSIRRKKITTQTKGWYICVMEKNVEQNHGEIVLVKKKERKNRKNLGKQIFR